MDMFLPIILIAYLIGSIPFGLILVRLAGKGDIRKIGSGNIGATNVLRTGSKKLAALTLLLDGGKGAMAVLIGQTIDIARLHSVVPYDMHLAHSIEWPSPVFELLTAFAVMLGHIFPIWLKFKGGKGVATALGVFIGMDIFWLGLPACLTWLIIAILFRYSSLAALIAMIIPIIVTAIPIMILFISNFDSYANPNYLVFATIAAISLLVITRHYANIRRLFAGTELKIGQHSQKTGNATP